MRIVRILLASIGVLVLVALVSAGLYLVNSKGVTREEALGRAEIAQNGNVQGRLYPGDPDAEAELVKLENQRVFYVRNAVIAATRAGFTTPYQVDSGTSMTLVLPPRADTYTFDDLATAAPTTFVRRADGNYTFWQSVAVLPGATLSLTAEVPTTISLLSSPTDFVSIIGLGGDLTISGTEQAPISFTSYIPESFGPDMNTVDGRAYIQLLGGKASFSNANFSDLAFWSGGTGGVSLIGSESVDLVVPTSEQSEAKPGAGAQILPTDQIAGVVADGAGEPGLVEGTIARSTFTGNAYGLYVTSATRIEISDSTMMNNLVDGLVLHRSVSNATITSTESSGNAVDGFVVDRSSSLINFDKITASSNARNGASIDGRALADGPNAAGSPVQSYGGTDVRNGTFIGNGRYGVELSGGVGIVVSDNRFRSNMAGLVANHAAQSISVVRNRFENQRTQAVSIRDNVVAAEVQDNEIVGGDTGIYVRDAEALILRNTTADISGHAVSIVGDASGVSVQDNALRGYGSSPLWTAQSAGAAIGDNDVEGWSTAITFERSLRSFLQPLTIVWILLGVLLLFTISTRRGGQYQTITHPYEHHVPLTEISKGIVSPESLATGRHRG